MKIYEIIDILSAEVLTGENCLDMNISAGGGADLMNDILAAAAEGAVLLTGFTSEEVVRAALIAGVKAVVFVRGKRPNNRIIELAQSYNLPILLTKYSLFSSCGRLYIHGLRGLDGSW